MLNNIKSAVGYDFFDLYNYRLRCFLNSRNKSKSWSWCSYEKWEKGVFNLNLVTNKTKIDLIRWFDSVPDIEERKQALLKKGFTFNDIERVKILLSRLGYLFRIDRNCSDKDYRLFFFTLQMINVKNRKNSIPNKNNTMTILLQGLLCELFMNQEDFSLFRVEDEGIVFKTENLGPAYLHDFVSLLFLNKKTVNSERLGLFYFSLINFLSVKDKNRYHLDFDDKNEKFIYFDFLCDLSNNERKERQFFKAISGIIDTYQSPHEIFISNMLLMAYIFYILIENPANILKLKEFTKDENIFFHLLEAVIKRRLIIGHHHFSSMGLDSYLRKIKINESQFYNIAGER